ncbi:diguanylate cyclase [Candidatus Obscuribacterales bacterium]|nr:diguanylate cyclase [Candidatus Obscuribacterales bacterium]MBX3138804.1 diguanylate cyclase [Candidatus Obscuribacterales bacterium]MBX3148903.1 diguanylate cyclase [Candidatus Obscuribacterales bacterium]
MKTGQKILVVDDEHAITLLLSEVLKDAGYVCDSANDGFKAIAACKVRTPDVIILDLNMPLMGGMAVYQRLKKEEKTSHIPIIFLGSKDEPVPDIVGDEPENEDIIFKPVQPTELLTRVKSILREKALRDELRKKEAQIKELSLTDNLTDLKSIRYLNEFLKLGIKQARRYGVPLSVVVLEVDNHKDLLKHYGQKVADGVVAQIGTVIGKQMRDSDIIVRSGPFEFIVGLTVTPRDGAIEVAERLRTCIQDSNFLADKDTLNITVGVGICQFAPHMDDDGKVLLSHARAAVEHAHKDGGNRSLMAE